VAASYRPLWEAGVAVDFAHPESDLSPYALVVVPNLYLVTDAGAANLAAHVAGGGTLLMGRFSGVVDEHDRVRSPPAFRNVLGISVEEFHPLAEDEKLCCVSDALGRFEAGFWAEHLHAEGAEAVATIEGGDLAGVPAVLRHVHGRGTAWYVATRPEPAAVAALTRLVCAEAGVTPAADVPPGVEAVRRGDVLFLLNHGDGEAVVALDGRHLDLLSGAARDGSVALGRFGAAALRREPLPPLGRAGWGHE
jgi:beta-galactosidase